MKSRNLIGFIAIFLMLIGFVYGEIIDNPDADYLKEKIGVSIEPNCNGCRFEIDENNNEKLTLAPNVKIKPCAESSCWAGVINLNGGTIIYPDGSELTGLAEGTYSPMQNIKDAILKLESGEIINIKDFNGHLSINRGVITGDCLETCNVGGFQIAMQVGESPVNFRYENGVLYVENAKTLYTSNIMSLKNIKLNSGTNLMLPDSSKVITDGVVKLNDDGSFGLPPSSKLRISGAGKEFLVYPEEATTYIDIRNKDAKCDTNSNCIHFMKESIDIYNKGKVNIDVSEDFEKKSINVYPLGEKAHIETRYPKGPTVTAKDKEGYPKIEPSGGIIPGNYKMVRLGKLSYNINKGEIQACSVQFNQLPTGSAVKDKKKPNEVKCINGNYLAPGMLDPKKVSFNPDLAVEEYNKIKYQIYKNHDGDPIMLINPGKGGFIYEGIYEDISDLDSRYKKGKRLEDLSNKAESKISNLDSEQERICTNTFYDPTRCSEISLQIKRYRADILKYDEWKKDPINDNIHDNPLMVEDSQPTQTQPLPSSTQQPKAQSLLEQICPVGSGYIHLKMDEFNKLYYDELKSSSKDYCDKEWDKGSKESSGCMKALEKLCIIYSAKKMGLN